MDKSTESTRKSAKKLNKSFTKTQNSIHIYTRQEVEALQYMTDEYLNQKRSNPNFPYQNLVSFWKDKYSKIAT